MSDITMPRLSDSMEQGTIASWLKADGDHVEAGDELVEIETDKATMTYEAPEAGTLAIVAGEGTALAVGELMGRGSAPAPRPTAASRPPTAGPPRHPLFRRRLSPPGTARRRESGRRRWRVALPRATASISRP
jgi:pyruvate dehydrogenase E2 component (dihydrolipoamide acetyltransferase)